MVFLIIITGVLCGTLPTVLWWRERKENIRLNGKLTWYRKESWFDGREKVAWRMFMKKLAKNTNITKNCKECGRFFKLTKDDLLDRGIPEYCSEHRLRNKFEYARRQRDMMNANSGLGGDPENLQSVSQLGLQGDIDYLRKQRIELTGQ